MAYVGGGGPGEGGEAACRRGVGVGWARPGALLQGRGAGPGPGPGRGITDPSTGAAAGTAGVHCKVGQLQSGLLLLTARGGVGAGAGVHSEVGQLQGGSGGGVSRGGGHGGGGRGRVHSKSCQSQSRTILPLPLSWVHRCEVVA